MDTHRFFVEQLRFHLTEKKKIVFAGWFYDGSTRDHTLSATLDGEELPLALTVNKGAQVRQKYIRCVNEIEEEVVGIISLPDDWKRRGKLRIRSTFRGEPGNTYTVSGKKLCALEKSFRYYIESCHREGAEVTVTGWALAGEPVEALLADHEGKPYEKQETTYYHRRDLLPVFPEADANVKPGFQVKAFGCGDLRKTPLLRLTAGDAEHAVRLRKWDNGSLCQRVAGKADDALRYLSRNGLSATWYKVLEKLRKKETNPYGKWREKYQTKPEELARQRETHLPKEPLFSIAVPLYRTDPGYLRELNASVQAQTYGNWQLCLADGSAGAG